MTAINFLTHAGQASTPIKQEFFGLSGVLGVSALVDMLNGPKDSGGTPSSLLGPFFTEDAPDSTVIPASSQYYPHSSPSQYRRYYRLRGYGRVYVCRRARIGYPWKAGAERYNRHLGGRF